MELPLTPEELQKLAVPGTREAGLSEPAEYKAYGIARRIGSKKVEEAVRRYQDGESARSIAARLDVSTAAVINLLRDNAVVVAKQRVTEAEATRMAAEYEAGATVAELEKAHKLSHGAVLRSLHRSGVTMRAKAPRKLSK